MVYEVVYKTGGDDRVCYKTGGDDRVCYKADVPPSCPGVPPLVASYDIAFTGNIVYAGADKYTSPEVVTGGSSCNWEGSTSGYYQSITLESGFWEVRFRAAFPGAVYCWFIRAEKAWGSTPVGAYTVIQRDYGASGMPYPDTNDLDDIVVSET